MKIAKTNSICYDKIIINLKKKQYILSYFRNKNVKFFTKNRDIISEMQ